MTERLSSLDASFLYMENATTVMHAGSVLVFERAAGTTVEDVVDLVARRVATVPRLRQRVVEVPARLGAPVWVDDEEFDLAYHVRLAALPRPGNREQLEEFVARVMPRGLDRRRPLWELYVVEGLDDDQLAIVTKTHHAMVDGRTPVDLAQVVVSDTPDIPEAGPDLWRPRPAPSGVRLVGDAIVDSVFAPGQLLDTVRGGIGEVQAAGTRVLSGVGSLLDALARGAAAPAPTSPLNAEVGSSRRFLAVDTELETYRTVRSRVARAGRRGATAPAADEVTVNDVILATVTGALRSWLLMRGEPIYSGSVVRALVPVITAPDGDEQLPGTPQSRLRACIVDLPVGEAGAFMRLHQIAFAMRQQTEGGQAVRARSLVRLAGFAPPTLHSLGARMGSNMSRRLFNVIVTNSPGPQQPLYAGACRLVSTYPVIPLAEGQALSFGVTSYDGSVCYGLNADRVAMPDLEVFEQGLHDALDELAGASGPAVGRRGT